MTSDKDENKVRGGIARAESLSPQKRQEIAKMASSARWDKDLPVTDYEGSFKLGGEKLIACAVLPNGKRVITQSTFLTSLGRSRSPKAGTGVLSTVDGLPFFLQAEGLKPFIPNELVESTTPIFYRTKTGAKSVGYDAALLPQVAEVYLRYRDAMLAEKGVVPKQYAHIVSAADLLMRGLANVGIIALIDEATGYQRDRARDALEKILEAFIAKELKPWVHTFPDEYYANLFRLRGLEYPRDTVKKPQYFGHITNDLIYRRLAPAVLEELKKSTPKDEKGRHKHQFHRLLTTDVGHPKLREHLAAVVTVMKLSDSYDQLIKMLDRTHPRYGETPRLPFIEESGL